MSLWKYYRLRNERIIITSSSTPSAAYTGSELLYGPDGMSRQLQGDDLAGSDISGYERDKQRLRDLDMGNKRPQSKNKRTSYSIVDKVNFDRDREDTRVLNNSLPSKPPTFRGNGIRSSLVREQLLTQRTLGGGTGRDSDDLIAMGTLWSPANNNTSENSNGLLNNAPGSSSGAQATRSSGTTTASNKSSPSNSQNNGSNSCSSTSQRKPLSVSVNTTGRLGHSSSFNGIFNTAFGRQLSNSNSKEDVKYPDPLLGAPASFQQRLMELASLEAETIRWERTKKVKKKPRQDRDI